MDAGSWSRPDSRVTHERGSSRGGGDMGRLSSAAASSIRTAETYAEYTAKDFSQRLPVMAPPQHEYQIKDSRYYHSTIAERVPENRKKFSASKEKDRAAAQQIAEKWHARRMGDEIIKHRRIMHRDDRINALLDKKAKRISLEKHIGTDYIRKNPPNESEMDYVFVKEEDPDPEEVFINQDWVHAKRQNDHEQKEALMELSAERPLFDNAKDIPLSRRHLVFRPHYDAWAADMVHKKIQQDKLMEAAKEAELSSHRRNQLEQLRDRTASRIAFERKIGTSFQKLRHSTPKGMEHFDLDCGLTASDFMEASEEVQTLDAVIRKDWKHFDGKDDLRKEAVMELSGSQQDWSKLNETPPNRVGLIVKPNHEMNGVNQVESRIVLERELEMKKMWLRTYHRDERLFKLNKKKAERVALERRCQTAFQMRNPSMTDWEIGELIAAGVISLDATGRVKTADPEKVVLKRDWMWYKRTGEHDKKEAMMELAVERPLFENVDDIPKHKRAAVLSPMGDAHAAAMVSKNIVRDKMQERAKKAQASVKRDRQLDSLYRRKQQRLELESRIGTMYQRGQSPAPHHKPRHKPPRDDMVKSMDFAGLDIGSNSSQSRHSSEFSSEFSGDGGDRGLQANFQPHPRVTEEDNLDVGELERSMREIDEFDKRLERSNRQSYNVTPQINKKNQVE